MSSSSPPVDYQKPVKVKSRWTQSCQIEMMMEESQSSLDMSDTVTDVSSSDSNDSTDYSSEFNSLELRKSRTTSSNRTNYRQSNRKKQKISSKNFNEKELKEKELSNMSDNDQENKFKYNISQESNFKRNTSVDWNTISIFQSKSVNNISENIDNLPSKPIRRASVPWKFKFSFTKDLKDNIRLLEKDDYYNLSNAIKYLNLNKILLSEDNKSTQKENTTNKDTSQQSYCINVCNLNCRDFDGLSNKILNIEVSAENKLQQSHELNMDVKHFNEKYQNTNLEVPKSFLFKSKNLKCNSIYKLREIRSKSCDSILKKPYYSFKRCKSYDDLNQLKESVIDSFKLQKPEKKSPKKKRRQSKRIKTKNNCIEMLDDMKVPEVNYNLVADEIYKEHKNQLLEARINDIEFDEKLKATNFTLVDENVYRPNR